MPLGSPERKRVRWRHKQVTDGVEVRLTNLEKGSAFGLTVPHMRCSRLGLQSMTAQPHRLVAEVDAALEQCPSSQLES